MKTLEQTIEAAKRQNRFSEAAHLQEIEDNPLSADDKAMFDMFEREGWSDEQCRDHIIKLAQRDATFAAE